MSTSGISVVMSQGGFRINAVRNLITFLDEYCAQESSVFVFGESSKIGADAKEFVSTKRRIRFRFMSSFLDEKSKPLKVIAAIKNCIGLYSEWHEYQELSDSQTLIVVGNAYMFWPTIKANMNAVGRVVYFANELPMQYRQVSRSHFVLFSRLEMDLIRNSQFIICSNEERRKFMVLNSTIKESKCFVVHNYPDIHSLETEKCRLTTSISRSKAKSFCITGMISENRLPREVLWLFSELGKIHNTMLVVAGEISKAYTKRFRKYLKEYPSIEYVGPISRLQAIDIQKASVAGLAVYYGEKPNDVLCAPQKIYEYLNCGIPIICSENPPLVELVSTNQLGIILDRRDFQRNFRNLESFLENVSEARYRVESWRSGYMSEKVIISEFEALFSRLEGESR